MIECPICHVSNEDRSLFCAECGQRFSSSVQSNEPPNALLKAPIQDAIPRRPTAKLHSPVLDGPAALQEPGYGFPSSSNSSVDAMVSGRAAELANPEPKMPETDKSESGGGSAPLLRRGLHSPLLDGDGAAAELEAPQRSQSAFPHRQSKPSSAPITEAKPLRPGKFLRSPLLGGGFDPDEEATPRPQMSDSGSIRPERPGRLHSPVLDGGASDSDEFGQADYEVEEVNNANVLRSPLLAAKVPLPEKPASSKSLVVNEDAKPVPPAFNSPLGVDQARVVSPNQASPLPLPLPLPLPAQPPVASVNQGFPSLPVPQTPPVASSFPSTSSPTTEPVKPVGGFEDLNLVGRSNQPAAPVVRGPALAANYAGSAKPNTGRSPEPTSNEWPVEEKGSRPFKTATPTRSVLLDKAVEESLAPSSVRTRRLSTPVVVLLLAVLIFTKAFYIISLGPSAFSSSFVPFLVDQVAQLLVIICLIICA